MRCMKNNGFDDCIGGKGFLAGHGALDFKASLLDDCIRNLYHIPFDFAKPMNYSEMIPGMQLFPALLDILGFRNSATSISNIYLLVSNPRLAGFDWASFTDLEFVKPSQFCVGTAFFC